MGYDLHILRKKNVEDFEEESNISPEEWIAYATADPELENTNGYGIKTGEEKFSQNQPGFFEWKAHPEYDVPNSRPWFDYWRGTIHTKNPDEYVIAKMLLIAGALNAVVQGDDGEFYDEAYLKTMIKNGAFDYTAEIQAKKRTWWKFW